MDWSIVAEGLEELLTPRREALNTPRRGREARNSIRFTDLEKRVLEESRLRGERFYRLTCIIDPSEPLPYPRAYLISSRLETGDDPGEIRSTDAGMTRPTSPARFSGSPLMFPKRIFILSPMWIW